jgi:ethanolamine utilization protein EutP (predicted NTPase)
MPHYAVFPSAGTVDRDQHLIHLHGKGRSLKDTSRVEYNDRGDSQRPCEGLLRRSKSYLFLIIGSGRRVFFIGNLSTTVVTTKGSQFARWLLTLNIEPTIRGSI